MDFLNSLKVFVIGIMVTVNSAAVPVVNPPITSSPLPVPSVPVATIVISPQVPVTVPSPDNPKTTNSPLPLTGDNYHYIRGSYSYLGAIIRYHFLIPKNGGSFSGSIEGACKAQVGGDYSGGSAGIVSGSASGECNIFFVKYKGSVNFKGTLYPNDKKIIVKLENTPLSPITLNYN